MSHVPYHDHKWEVLELHNIIPLSQSVAIWSGRNTEKGGWKYVGYYSVFSKTIKNLFWLGGKNSFIKFSFLPVTGEIYFQDLVKGKDLNV